MTASTWDIRWMDLAKLVSSWSKDLSTKCGAVVVDNRNTMLSMGWNGFPRRVDDNIPERHERPQKYKWTEHAERNAVYNAANTGARLDGANIYITFFPCSDCARAIIQSGIRSVVTYYPDFGNERWGDDFKFSLKMLEEAHVEVCFFQE
jgi:dCMP deaminase